MHNEKSLALFREAQAVIPVWLRGSCRLPRLMDRSENGKIVRQEQLGAPNTIAGSLPCASKAAMRAVLE